MSAFVISNPDVGDAKFAGVHHSRNVFVKPESRLARKNSFFVIITLVILAIVGIAIGLLAYFLAKGSSSSSKSTLPQFKEMAGDMKKSNDPCYDFYEYSCGSYIDKYLPNRLTSSIVLNDKFSSLLKDNLIRAKDIIEGMGNTNDPVFKKAYTYYKACMSGSRSLSPYFTAADKIGGSHITTIGPFDYSKWNLEDALKTMKLLYNANPLFKIHVSHDLFNASRNIFTIMPPDTAIIYKLAGEDDMLPSIRARSDDVFEYDFDAISTLAGSFSDRLSSSFATSASIRTGKGYLDTYRKILAATNFEKKLLLDLQKTFAGFKVRDHYKVVKVRELNNLTNYGIRWSTLLQSLSPVGSSFNVNNETEVALWLPLSYLTKVKYYVSPLYYYRSKLPDYFAWFMLKKFSPVLPDEYFAQYYFNAPASVIGTKGKERWRACLLETETTMPLSVGMMFTKSVITPLVAKNVSDMLKEIENAFKTGSKQLTWLDQVTKNAVEEKIKRVLNLIAAPDLFQNGWLSDKYKDVTVVGRTYPQIFESSLRNMVQINLKRYFQAPKRDEFDFGGHIPKLYDVNAFYDRSKNLIMILAGIMRPSFVYEDGPYYINFAKIGAVLGHELLHGFDNSGWNFDKFGQISQWTTKHSQDGFKIRADCVKRQYGFYLSGSKYINGTMTLGENIADNAGLKYAYLGYKSFAARHKLNETKPPELTGLSYDQLFFIGYAQMWCRAASRSAKDIIALRSIHSPNRYRVIGSVSNFQPFADAFKCSKGTPMNPTSRCAFW